MLKQFIKNSWNRFEIWVNSWFPKLKTKIIAVLGVIGMLAAALQDFVTQLPTTEFVSSRTVAFVSAGLFTLAYWFRGIGERVETIIEKKPDLLTVKQAAAVVKKANKEVAKATKVATKAEKQLKKAKVTKAADK